MSVGLMGSLNLFMTTFYIISHAQGPRRQLLTAASSLISFSIPDSGEVSHEKPYAPQWTL